MKNSHKVCDLIFEDSFSVLLMLGVSQKRLLFSIIPLTDFSYVKSLSLTLKSEDGPSRALGSILY